MGYNKVAIKHCCFNAIIILENNKAVYTIKAEKRNTEQITER